MKKLWLFEEKKLWQTGKVYLFLAGGFLLLVTLFGFNSYMSHQENEAIQEEGQLSKPVMNQNDFNKEQAAYLEGVNLSIELQEADFRERADKGQNIDDILTLPTYPYYRTALNKELLSKELPPQSMRYGTKNSLFAAVFLTYAASILGIIYALFLFGDSFSGELEAGTMRLGLSQPIRRRDLFFSKYLLAVLHSFLTIAGLTGIAFVVGSLFSGGSSIFYPVIVFTEISMTFIPVIQYMLQVLLLLLFVLLFCFALHFLISTIVRKTIVSLTLTVFLLLEGYLVSVSSADFLRKIAHLNPFTYLNVGKVFIGYDFRSYGQYSIENQEYYANWCLPRVLHNPSIGMSSGMICLIAAAAILLLIGNYCFKRNVYWKK
ncbi:ABC transporter permease [Enterococcus sp. LJL51]|uniref:ABC transporter permease n=1 Tax=Enterococcus sp. LJL51 TaxID=3416656 RepID=UPI003CF29716